MASAPLTTTHTFASLLEALEETGGRFDQKRLRKAFEKAAEIYGDKKHWTGDSLFDHCVGVLVSLLPVHPDEDAAVACFFHHVLDSEKWTFDDVEAEFGFTVRSIVSDVHLLSKVSTTNKRISVENLRLMFLRISHDIRAILIV